MPERGRANMTPSPRALALSWRSLPPVSFETVSELAETEDVSSPKPSHDISQLYNSHVSLSRTNYILQSALNKLDVLCEAGCEAGCEVGCEAGTNASRDARG